MIKTHRPTAVFDIDGVLADFCTNFTALAVELGLTDKIVSNGDQDEWSFDFHVDPVWAKVDGSHYFWESLPLLTTDDDLDAMHALAQEAHIMYVTGRAGNIESTARQTHRWLQDNDYPEGPVFFVPPKTEKEGVILPNKYQIIGMLEDKPSILSYLASEGVPVVARDWPYNRSVSVPRVSSVAEFVDRLGVRHTQHVGQIFPGWTAEYWDEFPEEVGDDAGGSV